MKKDAATRLITRFAGAYLAVSASVPATVEATSTTVEATASTMESTISVEVAATVESTIAMEAAVAVKAFPAEAVAIVAATSVIATAPVVKIASVPAVTVIAVIPGTDADEDAVHEPVRAVVAVWGASIRIIVVIAIGANRGGANDDGGSNGNAEADLGMSTARRGKE